MEQENRQITDKRLENLKTDAGPGRPKGQRNFATIYREAIEKIAKSKDISADEFEIQLVEQAIRKGYNGDTRFYTDTLDRIHGKAPQHFDHTTGGMPIQFGISEAIAKKNDIITETE
jgi:hypothetical protein